MSNRRRLGILVTIAVVGLSAIAAYAADGDFSGKWKGQQKATAPAGGRGGPGGAPPSGDGAAGTTQQAPAGGGGGGGFGGGGGGGGFGGGGGRPGGGGGGGFGGGGGVPGGGFGGSQKVQMNMKLSKDNKVSGNITFGESNALDIKDGKVENNTLTFSAGRAPEPIYAYRGEIKGDELILTRIAPAGSRGPQTTEFVLTKK